jgi:thiol-disulfide isomerase/thioredoxin
MLFCGIAIVSCRPQKTTTSSGDTDKNTAYNGNIWRFRGTIEVAYNPTYTGLFQKALKKRRPIFISFYTDWCTTCPFFNEGMIQKQPIVSLLEENFVSYIIDAERGDGYKLAVEYKIAVYPTILYLNSQGEEISRYVGIPDEHKVLQFAKSAIQAEEKFQEMKEKK